MAGGGSIDFRGALAYPFHDSTIHVTSCGRICLHRKKINLSTVFAGQAVGIKEVEEGIWLVSFMDYDLGYIDLEEKTLQPLDNPFGPKVLPMQPVRSVTYVSGPDPGILEPRVGVEPTTCRLLQKLYVVESSSSLLRLAPRFSIVFGACCSLPVPSFLG